MVLFRADGPFLSQAGDPFPDLRFRDTFRMVLFFFASSPRAGVRESSRTQALGLAWSMRSKLAMAHRVHVGVVWRSIQSRAGC